MRPVTTGPFKQQLVVDLNATSCRSGSGRYWNWKFAALWTNMHFGSERLAKEQPKEKVWRHHKRRSMHAGNRAVNHDWYSVKVNKSVLLMHLKSRKTRLALPFSFTFLMIQTSWVWRPVMDHASSCFYWKGRAQVVNFHRRGYVYIYTFMMKAKKHAVKVAAR